MAPHTRRQPSFQFGTSVFIHETSISSEMLRLVPEVRVATWLQIQIDKDAQFISVVTFGKFRGVGRLERGTGWR